MLRNIPNFSEFYCENKPQIIADRRGSALTCVNLRLIFIRSEEAELHDNSVAKKEYSILNCKHAIERDARPMRRLLRHRNLIDDLAVEQILKRPEHIFGSDSKHR
jgi:hypothetical protein